MSPREALGFGTEFVAKHRELIKRILITYANSVNVICAMSTVGDRHHSPLEFRRDGEIDGTGADGYNYEAEAEAEAEDEDEDEERLYAQDFDTINLPYMMKLGLREELNRIQLPQNISVTSHSKDPTFAYHTPAVPADTVYATYQPNLGENCCGTPERAKEVRDKSPIRSVRSRQHPKGLDFGYYYTPAVPADTVYATYQPNLGEN